MGTFQRPASSPNFSVISCAEGEEDGEGEGVLISSVFSLIALTLKQVKLGLEGGVEAELPILNSLVFIEREADEKQVPSRAPAIASYSKFLTKIYIQAAHTFQEIKSLY